MESIPVPASSPAPRFGEALRFWMKLGFISFGGPAGQIAIMHTELVDRKKWVGESLFLHALNFCMLLPGPEAQQLATYLGWRLHGVKGGIAAGALFVLPSAILLWGLSWLYLTHGQVPWVAAVFYGLQPAVMAIVAAAVLRIGRKALKSGPLWAVAAVSFASIFWLKVPFVLMVVGAGVVGWCGARLAPATFLPARPTHGPAGDPGDPPSVSETTAMPSWKQAARMILAGSVLWWAPILAVGMVAGWTSVWFLQGVFFSKAALITFGGAYAVLPYVAQQAVEHHGWLSVDQMMTGLALAETTPGPLIMVLQFVGFVGAWQHPAPLSPLLAGTLGAAITTWATFLPSFILVLTGAPYIEQLQKIRVLTAVLTAITAAVVGVILNLAVWFGMHALVPAGQGVDVFAVVVSAVLFWGLHYRKWDVIPVVVAGGGLGLVWRMAGLGG